MRRHHVLILIAVLAGALAAAPIAAAGCIKPRQARFAQGRTPAGQLWTASASVKKNANCHEWLFGIDFSVPGFIDWGSGTGIPRGGHVSRYETISAFTFENEDGSERAFGGYTGREVATIQVTLDDGHRFEVHPRFPPSDLRRKYAWMRSFRYFLDFTPIESRFAEVQLFNRAGTLLFRTKRPAEEELF